MPAAGILSGNGFESSLMLEAYEVELLSYQTADKEVLLG
jgi:hypothetical protein